MAYTPTEWECGEIVTSERLNKLEEGVADIMSEYVPTEWQCGDVITAEKLNRLEQAVAEASEGGSSDFSTAKLTYSGIAQIYISRIYADGDNTLVTPIIADPGTYDVVLYNGVAYGALDHVLGNVSVDGAIEYDDGSVIITGDCTITIS